jgi:MFS family permease
LSVSTVFFLVGFSFATWASRIPTIRDDLALSNGQVALALIGFNSGIVLASLVVGGLVTRFGSRTILIISLMWYSAALPLIALAPTLPLLAAAMLLVAIGNCGVDITMNAQGSLVERAYGRPVLASFHAVFSLGALAGGGIGALVTSVHVSTLAHFTTVAVVMILIAVPAAPGLLRESSRTSGFGRNGTSRKRLSFPTSAILLPGAICFCAMMGEGIMNNWSALYLRDVVGSDGGAAAIGITVFSVGMLTGRLTADRIHRRFGTRAFIIACSATASVGAILVIATGTYVVCLIGAVVLGLGLAAIVPVVFSHSAAQDPERYGSAIAKVTAIGYTAFLTGPPIVGGLAEAFGLPTGMMTLPVLMLVMIILATRLRRASTVPP